MQEIKNEIYNVYEYNEQCAEGFNSNSTWQLAFEEINDKERVLELGCATGYWGTYLKKHKNVEIYGLDFLEYHVNKAKETNCYNEVVQYDLNKIDNSLDYLAQSFDKVVILDVLEHLYNPAEVLQWCKKMLKPQGKLIISIPNVAHKTILQQLFLNEFNYTQNGLLDRTHIRFFTLTTFADLLANNGFETIDLKRVMEFESEYSKKIPSKVNMFFELQPETNTFQYVFIAKEQEKTNLKEINRKRTEEFKKEYQKKYKTKLFLGKFVKLIPFKKLRQEIRQKIYQ